MDSYHVCRRLIYIFLDFVFTYDGKLLYNYFNKSHGDIITVINARRGIQFFR